MIFKVKIPIYNRKVIVIFGNDRAASEPFLAREGFGISESGQVPGARGDEELYRSLFEDPCSGITVGLEDSMDYVFVRVDHMGNHATIAHEIYHAVCCIMAWAGIHPGPQTDEAYAYLIGFLTEEVYNQIENGK